MKHKPPCQVLTALLGLMVFSIASAAGDVYHFEVLLDDRPIGEHRFEIKSQGEQQLVSSRAELDVRFLFFSAYRYRHSSDERFRNGCLEQIAATTYDNGKRYRVDGTRLGEDFQLKRDEVRKRLDGCIKTFAYWDPAILDHNRLLNPQTGELEMVRADRRGIDRIEVAGRELRATRYALVTDELTIDLWYHDELGWVRLASDTGKGARLIYRRI